jgi:transcriptional regulator with XRE-family HTH domain
MQAGRKSEATTVDRRESLEVRAWRRHAGLTRQEAAGELGVSPRMLAYYEDGVYPVPKTVLLAVRHLANSGHAERSFGRDRWVGAVKALLSYGRGEPIVGRLLRERRLDELADVLDLARCGPDPRTALTDPALFMALRDASTKMHLAGLLALREMTPSKLRDRAKRLAEKQDDEASVSMRP